MGNGAQAQARRPSQHLRGQLQLQGQLLRQPRRPSQHLRGQLQLQGQLLRQQPVVHHLQRSQVSDQVHGQPVAQLQGRPRRREREQHQPPSEPPRTARRQSCARCTKNERSGCCCCCCCCCCCRRCCCHWPAPPSCGASYELVPCHPFWPETSQVAANPRALVPSVPPSCHLQQQAPAPDLIGEDVLELLLVGEPRPGEARQHP